MENKAYKLSPEAEKLQEKSPDLFTILQSSEKPTEELQKQVQQFLESEGFTRMSPETLMSEIQQLSKVAPARS